MYIYIYVCVCVCSRKHCIFLYSNFALQLNLSECSHWDNVHCNSCLLLWILVWFCELLRRGVFCGGGVCTLYRSTIFAAFMWHYSRWNKLACDETAQVSHTSACNLSLILLLVAGSTNLFAHSSGPSGFFTLPKDCLKWEGLLKKTWKRLSRLGSEGCRWEYLGVIEVENLSSTSWDKGCTIWGKMMEMESQ